MEALADTAYHGSALQDALLEGCGLQQGLSLKSGLELLCHLAELCGDSHLYFLDNALILMAAAGVTQGSLLAQLIAEFH
jgi:hypothetical protein